MAFFSKVGNILKQHVSKQVTAQLSATNPSFYQALRCMSSNKVFVGGLPFAVDDTSLREAFSPYGEVVDARVIVDREQNRSRGFGFVTFSSSEEASSAIQALDGQDMQGRRVRVNYAAERAPRQFGGGGGYGGGGYGGGGYGGGGYGGGGYGGGGYGGQSSGGQYGGGAGYGGDQGYGGGNYGGQNYTPNVQNSGGNGGFSGGDYGVTGGNVTAETGFASSGLEDGPADVFGSNTSGGYGGQSSGGQYGGGAGYGGGQGYGGGNYGGQNYTPNVQHSGGNGGFSGGDYGVTGGVGGSDNYYNRSGGNVTAETGFASSGLEDGPADVFGSNTSGGLGDDLDSKVPPEESFGDDDEPNDFAKRA